MKQFRLPALLLLTLLLIPACRETGQEAKPEKTAREVARAVRIQQSGGAAPHRNIHHVSRPLLLEGSGRFSSALFTVPPGAEMETAYGISGGRFARPAGQTSATVDEAERPVTFTLSFEPRSGGAPRTLHQETLDAAPDRSRQWWRERRIDLSPLAGATGSFIFETGPVPAAEEALKPRNRPVPVWAESVLRPRAAGGRGRLIILVSADTCRADALGCYGQQRWTTPHLDAFSRQCLLFENAYGPSPWTLPSHASLLTATYPNVHLLETYRPTALSPQIRTLTEELAAAGFLTAAFVDMGFITPFKGLHRGFDLFDYRGTGIRQISERLLPWILQRPADDLFLFFHFYDIHFPYDEQIPGRTFGAGTQPDGVDHRVLTNNRASDPAVAAHLHDLYHNGVAYTDEAFGRVLAALRGSGRYRDALIVFLSDHGEEFAEHGRLGHQLALFQESLAVPLLIKLPGNRLAGSRSPLPASLVDLMPTILGQAGLSSPPGSGGIDLLGPAPPDPDARFVFGETVLEGSASALIGRRYKLIHQAGSDTILTDLKTDPGELQAGHDRAQQDRFELMTQALVTDHLWRRPGLHIWFAGLEPGTALEITVGGRSLQFQSILPFRADLQPADTQPDTDVWRARFTPRDTACGLVLGFKGDPPEELTVRVTDVPLRLPGGGPAAGPAEWCRCPLNSPQPGATELDLLDKTRTPLGLVHYRHRAPSILPEPGEEDREVTDRLRQLGYLE